MEKFDLSDRRQLILGSVAGGSILLNVLLASVLLGTAPESAPQAEVSAATPAEPTTAELAQSNETPALNHEAGEIEASEEHPEEVAKVMPPAPPENLKVASASVARNLPYTIHQAVGDGSDALAATTARLFVWDLDLRRDLQAGDEVQIAWVESDPFPEIQAATFRSNKLGRTIRAYRFQASGDLYPSYWDENGVEIPHRLKETPLPSGYEQVTSLLKDRPTHAGMDFKVASGTEVVSPRSGVVTRANWNVANNGNCVEVQWSGGLIARFLHLSETSVKPGQKVAAGAVVGKSGNTGRSTAPHLHYEIKRSGRTVDPIDVHGTYRRDLPASDQEAFQAQVQRFDSYFLNREAARL